MVAAARFRFDILGMSNVAHYASALNRWSGDIRSVKPQLERAVDEVIRPRIRLNFANQEAAGNAWEPLSSETKFWSYRASRNAGGNPTLDVTGKLKRVAQQKNVWDFRGSGQAGAVYASMPASAFYGTYHQMGFYNQKAGRDVPAREFIIINEADVRKISDMFDNWVAESFGKTIGRKGERITVGERATVGSA